MEPINKIWTEKYRPKKVSEMVGEFKEKITKYLDKPDELPHFLLYSKSPGTGKTSLSKAIINELGCDALIINSSDDRKIDTIRDKVKGFSMTKSSKENKRRCVFLDEADGMLKIPQDALRNLMETYASNVFFILTANNINKIIEPLQSRCVAIPFAYPKKEEIAHYLVMICESEKMEYTAEGINEVVEKNYPSIRNCVLTLQDMNTQELKVIPENVKPVNQIFDDMWKLLQDKKWQEIKKIILSSTVEPRDLNTYFWEKAIDDENLNLKLIQICCRNERDIALGSDAKIIFVTSIIEMCK